MFILIGLGNPGKRYQNHRHNVGQRFIGYLTKNINKIKIKLLETDCFMNLSGNFVKKTISKYRIPLSKLIIVHDDLDIPFGKFKIQKGVGPKLHKGIESIENALGAKDFWRIRIGVDNRSLEDRIDGESYVLQDFLPEEKKIIENQVFPKILERIKDVFIIH